jgi:hypothetical protein
MKTLSELEVATTKWSMDRGIIQNGKVPTQALKLVSEIGELSDAIIKGEEIHDHIGDVLVLLTNICAMSGTNLTECWNVAYNDIKDRKGFLNAEGNFIKEEDRNYAKLFDEFQNS